MITAPRYKRSVHLFSIARLANRGRKYCNNPASGLLFRSETEALFFAIKTISYENHLKVAVPAFNCESVFEAVFQTGNEILFYDLIYDGKLYYCDESAIATANVIIITQLFGNTFHGIVDLKKRYPEKIFIEDAAHCDFRTYQGNLEFDLSLFSFNFHKPIAIGFGGMLVTHSTDLEKKFKIEYAKLRTAKFGLAEYIRKFINEYFYTRLIYMIIYSTLQKKRNSRKIYIEKCKIEPQKPCKIQRIVIAGSLVEKMDKSSDLQFESLYRFLIFQDSEKRDLALKFLEREGVDSFILWDRCLDYAKLYGNKRLTPRTEEFLKRVLFIPKSAIIKADELSGVM